MIVTAKRFIMNNWLMIFTCNELGRWKGGRGVGRSQLNPPKTNGGSLSNIKGIGGGLNGNFEANICIHIHR